MYSLATFTNEYICKSQGHLCLSKWTELWEYFVVNLLSNSSRPRLYIVLHLAWMTKINCTIYLFQMLVQHSKECTKISLYLYQKRLMLTIFCNVWFWHITDAVWWRNRLSHCATSRKVAGSIPEGVIGLFHWHNPSGRTMALGSTQPLTEMSTRNIYWDVKAAGAWGWQPYHLHWLTVLTPGSFNLLEPSGPVQACNGIAFTDTIYTVRGRTKRLWATQFWGRRFDFHLRHRHRPIYFYSKTNKIHNFSSLLNITLH